MADTLKEIATAVGLVIMTITSIVIIVPLGTLSGACAGWIIGQFFGDTILSITNQLGLHNITMWQLGAFLGFVGAFLKPKD